MKHAGGDVSKPSSSSPQGEHGEQAPVAAFGVSPLEKAPAAVSSLAEVPKTTAATSAPEPPLFNFSAAPAPPAVLAETGGKGSVVDMRYAFGESGRDKELRKKVAAIVARAAPAVALDGELAPTFLFGNQKKKTLEERRGTPLSPSAPLFPVHGNGAPEVHKHQAQTWTPISEMLLAANRVAQEAAKSPLPEIHSDGEEEGTEGGELPSGQPKAYKNQEEGGKPTASAPLAPVPVLGGNRREDGSSLQDTKAAASAPTDAAKKDVHEVGSAQGLSSGSGIPPFPFLSQATAPTPGTLPLSFGVTPASEKASSAATGDHGVPAMPFSFGFAATPATTTTKESEESGKKVAEPPSTGERVLVKKGDEVVAGGAPSSGGWGAAFLQANKAAATQAADAAAKESEVGEAKEPAAEPVAAPPLFNFGAAPSASAPTFTFGVAPASSAAGSITESAPKTYGFGEGAVGASAAAHVPTSVPAFSFGAPAPAATATPTAVPPPKEVEKPFFATIPKPTSDEVAHNGGTAESAPLFGVSVIQPPSAQPASFSFGAAGPATSTGGAATQPASLIQTAPTVPASTFTFGGGSASSAATPSTGFAFGAVSAPPAAPSTEAAPPAAFTFGAQPSTGSAFTFGQVSAPAPTPTPTAGFVFGSSAPNPVGASAFTFGAAQSEMRETPASNAFGIDSSGMAMEQNNSSAEAQANAGNAIGVGGFGFGSSGGGVPAFGASGGFGGGAPTQTTSSAAAPSFATSPGFGFGSGVGAGGFGMTSQQAPSGIGSSGFGAFGQPQSQPQSAFAFGSSAMPPPQMGATPFGGGFGAGSQQQVQPAPFGVPQPPPGAMVPNNPFGGVPGSGGGGFSIGSAGNSQSEGRRKVKVRRPGRK